MTFFRRPSLFYISILFVLSCIAFSIAQDTGAVIVTVGPNQSVRDISQKYLGAPDLWTDILKANNLASAADVKPGMKLTIPVKAISDALKALDKAHSAMETATKAGAKIFAVTDIENASASYDAASEKRRAGEWAASAAFARDAEAAAKNAYNICLKNKDVPGEASLYYKLGSVQSKKLVESVWNGAEKGDVLIEGEKVRTLSRSLAEIMFKDESRLRLEENSQALIQQMRQDLVEKKTKSSVSLVSGDLYALLSGAGASQKFDLIVPGVKTEINSTNFRVGKDESKSKFANYEGQLAVTSAGEKVVIEANQGSVVMLNQKPSKPQSLLPQPLLKIPADGEEIYNLDTPLIWGRIDGARQYKLEISVDKEFVQIVFSEPVKDTCLKKLPLLEAGAYYWRACAVDFQELVGQYCNPRSFIFMKDDKAPYLTLLSPGDNFLTAVDKLTISGETEPGAKLTVNGKPVQYSADGKFSLEITLNPGLNEIVVEAVDKAGNLTSISRKVTYRQAGDSGIKFDRSLLEETPNVFVVKDKAVTLRGTAEPGNTISIESTDKKFSASAFADKNGTFGFNLTLDGIQNCFRVSSLEPTGEIYQTDITIILDDISPEIIFDKVVPAVTADSVVEIAGRLTEGDRIIIGGKEFPVDNNVFSAFIELSSGNNKIILFASDKVGNTVKTEIEIYLDREPPQFVKCDILPSKVVGGELVQIFVSVTDYSALKKAAAYSIQAGDFVFEGYLTYSKTSGRYEGAVGIPAGNKGAVILKSVSLQDALGNEKTYNF